jgi:glycosyltransferase involved in cell wall biosynthesis
MSSSSMKIVLVHNLYQQPGGEDIVFDSEKRLLEQAGHEVIPYVRSNIEFDDTSIVDRISIAPQMLWSSKTRSEFAAILESERPDVVHVHNTFLMISPSIYSVCRQHGVPVVQTLHNFRLLCPAGSFYRNGRVCSECVDRSLLQSIRHGCYRNSRASTAGVALMLALHRILRTWCKSISRFITLTEFARRRFIEAGLPEEQFVVKPNFVDHDPQERSGPGEYAIYVGRFIENKGLGTLLKAWAQLPKQYSLHIVGDGPERAALEAQARAYGLPGIRFRGRLSHAETIEAIKAARFSIVPSTWYEGMPMCILEAFACGTPVLCSRIGGLPEIVSDHVTGLHCTPGDELDLASKVAWAYNHPAEIVKMGHAARRKYEADYTPERNYSLLLRIYEQASVAVRSRSELSMTKAPTVLGDL